MDLLVVADLAADGKEADLAAPDDLRVSVDEATPDAAVDAATVADASMPADAAPDLLGVDLTTVDLHPPDVVHFVTGVTVTTFAGSDSAGSRDDTGTAVTFQNPTGLAHRRQRRPVRHRVRRARVRRLDPSAVSSTVLAGQSGFVAPFAVVIAGGELYVQTDNDAAGLKYDSSGTIWHVSGGAATVVVTGLGRPRGLTALADGTVLVADRALDTVSLLDPNLPLLTPLAGAAGQAGYVDSAGAAARFDQPYGAATLADGSVLVADLGTHAIRCVAADGTVGTFAGDGQPGTIDGPRLSARFVDPKDLAVDAAGDVFVTDSGAHRVRRIRASDGEVETLAGDGVMGFQDGDGSLAEFYGQESLGVTADGQIVYVADGNGGDNSAHHRIRKLTIP